jgi:hypothetical protein
LEQAQFARKNRWKGQETRQGKRSDPGRDRERHSYDTADSEKTLHSADRGAKNVAENADNGEMDGQKSEEYKTFVNTSWNKAVNRKEGEKYPQRNFFWLLIRTATGIPFSPPHSPYI